MELFERVNAHLTRKVRVCGQGTIVDATIVATPTPTPTRHIAQKLSNAMAIRKHHKREAEERWEHRKAGLRAKVERAFRVIKRQLGYVKVRYRGIAKNAAQVFTVFMLSNPWM